MTNYYQCDNCRKTSSEHELVWVGEEGDGSPVCRHCWGFVSYAFSVCTATVIAVQEDKAKAKEIKTKPEMNWLKLWTWVAVSLGCVGFWARVVHFAWGHYVP